MTVGIRGRRPYRRVLLVGFMGSGKTSVGRVLAQLLGWSFFDFDEAVEAAAGRTIAEIFSDSGEPGFRELEAEIGAEALSMDRTVLAAGGGWPARPGRMEGLSPGTLSVWLLVSPRTAVRRVQESDEARPLLMTDDPVGEAERLLRDREAYYGLADHVLDSESGSVEQLARNIAGYVTDDVPDQGGRVRS